MHGKGEFSKIKGIICNAPIESMGKCNVLIRPSYSDGLIVGRLKAESELQIELNIWNNLGISEENFKNLSYNPRTI